MSLPIPRDPGQGGASLLEAVVAIIILSFAGTLLVANSRTSASGQERSKVYGEASTATKEVLESLRILGLDSLSRVRGRSMPHSQGPAIEVKATVRGVLPSDVDGFAGLDTATLRYVTLRTFFRSHAGAPVSKTFSTILYKP